MSPNEKIIQQLDVQLKSLQPIETPPPIKLITAGTIIIFSLCVAFRLVFL